MASMSMSVIVAQYLMLISYTGVCASNYDNLEFNTIWNVYFPKPSSYKDL